VWKGATRPLCLSGANRKLWHHYDSFVTSTELPDPAFAEFLGGDGTQGGINEIDAGEQSDVVVPFTQNPETPDLFWFRWNYFPSHRADDGMWEGLKAGRPFPKRSIEEPIVGPQQAVEFLAVEDPAVEPLLVVLSMYARRCCKTADSLRHQFPFRRSR